VTESNYMNFRDVVWETIDNFGTSIFFDEAFRPVEIDLVNIKIIFVTFGYLIIVFL
jgi:hypothetical protein